MADAEETKCADPLHQHISQPSTSNSKPIQQHLQATSKSNLDLHDKLIIDKHDFDCPLCFVLLYEPLTLECGHTFCRDCLYQTFQHKKNCPICRKHSSVDPVTYPLNVLVAKLLEKYAFSRYKKRSNELEKLKNSRKSRHPIFVSRTPEFPHCKISLHIYEAKYRVMVNRVVNMDSKFIIAYMQHPSTTPHSIGTLCVIKNCTSLMDGRSIVKVLGIKRVRLTSIKLESDSFGLLSAEIEDYKDIISTNIPKSSSILTDNTSNDNDKQTQNTITNKLTMDKSISNFMSNLNFLSKNLPNISKFSTFQGVKTASSPVGNTVNTVKKDQSSDMKESEALKESELMHKLLISVEQFVEHEESNTNSFYQRVGYPPKNISQFSFWIAGALPRRLLQSGGNNVEISQLQLKILVSRCVSERLLIAQNLATLCIQCSQKRSKIQFWIIVCIIGLAILYELLNGS